MSGSILRVVLLFASFAIPILAVRGEGQRPIQVSIREEGFDFDDGNEIYNLWAPDSRIGATSSPTDGLWEFIATSTTPPTVLPTGRLPPPSQFALDRGRRWSVTYVGDLKFTDKLGREKLQGDKCRTSKLGDKIIWNCGDMQCEGGWTVCGFDMGPAFYGTDDVMTVNTDGIINVQENQFISPWKGDPEPIAPQWTWGMDTSNVAPLNSTHGIAYAWQIWRGADDCSHVDRGNAVVYVTLGDRKPTATRAGPLLSDADAIQLGLLAILRDGDYVYIYSMGGPSNIIIGRVRADSSAFNPDSYEFLSFLIPNVWIPGIPDPDTIVVGARTANPGGKFGCAVYGSVFYSNYFHKYVIVCNIWMNFVNMYTSDTPWGPWSAEYSLMSSATDGKVAGSYGSMVHVEYAPGGSDKEVYFSMGPNTVFNMFRIRFDYDS